MSTQKAYTWIFIAVLFIIAKTWKAILFLTLTFFSSLKLLLSLGNFFFFFIKWIFFYSTVWGGNSLPFTLDTNPLLPKSCLSFAVQGLQFMVMVNHLGATSAAIVLFQSLSIHLAEEADIRWWKHSHPFKLQTRNLHHFHSNLTGET